MTIHTLTRTDTGTTVYDVPEVYHWTTECRGELAPAGYFLDWQSDPARELVYAIRTAPPGSTLNGQLLVGRWSHRQIAQTLGFQHWLLSYRAQDAMARRIRRDLARGNAPHTGNNTDHRAYARGRNMRTVQGAAPARPGARPDTSLASGRFGIEIEFNAEG